MWQSDVGTAHKIKIVLKKINAATTMNRSALNICGVSSISSNDASHEKTRSSLLPTDNSLVLTPKGTAMSPSRFVLVTTSLRVSFHRSPNACGGGDESERELKQSLFAMAGRSTSRRSFSVASLHKRIRWLSTVYHRSESKDYENRQTNQDCMHDDEEEEEEEFADDSSYYGEDCNLSSDSIEEQEELLRMLYAELYNSSD
jgi:hypothetical protein